MTATTVKEFMENNIMHSFGPPKLVVSDNEGCFTAVCLDGFMKEHGIRWTAVASYAPMSNGKAERMVGTIK